MGGSAELTDSDKQTNRLPAIPTEMVRMLSDQEARCGVKHKRSQWLEAQTGSAGVGQ